MKLAALIPSYQPTEELEKLAASLLIGGGFCRVLAVDDGSGAEYAPLFHRLEVMGCTVLRHCVNRGKGAALKTGLAALCASVPDLDAVVTADGDGQHHPEDIRRVGQAALLSPGSLILGTRDFSAAHVPQKSRWGNRFSAAYFRLFTGVLCPDTQTGLRGIPAALLPLALETPGERYDYEMAFLTEAARAGVPLRFVPVRTIYENGNAGSHFRPFADSMRIYKRPLRYLASSLTCAGVDLGAFTLLNALLPAGLGVRVLAATAGARLLSGGLNFTLNYAWAFESRRPAGGRALRYAALFCAQLAASWLLVWALSALPLPLTAVKALVDGGLFLASYAIQSGWIFRPEAPAGRMKLV